MSCSHRDRGIGRSTCLPWRAPIAESVGFNPEAYGVQGGTDCIDTGPFLHCRRRCCTAVKPIRGCKYYDEFVFARQQVAVSQTFTKRCTVTLDTLPSCQHSSQAFYSRNHYTALPSITKYTPIGCRKRIALMPSWWTSMFTRVPWGTM